MTRYVFAQNFNLFDKKRQGKLPKESMLTVLMMLGKCPSEARLNKIIAEELGAKADDGIDLDSYAYLVSRCTSMTKDQVEKFIIGSFQSLDADGSGFLSRDEIEKVLVFLGMKE